MKKLFYFSLALLIIGVINIIASFLMMMFDRISFRRVTPILFLIGLIFSIIGLFGIIIDNVIRKWKRNYSEEEVLEKIKKLRKKIIISSIVLALIIIIPTIIFLAIYSQYIWGGEGW